MLTARGNNQVAKGKGVLIKASTPNIKVTKLGTESLTAADGNMLVATPVDAESVTETGNKLYHLTFNDTETHTGLGFYWGDETGTTLKTKPNKAYLSVPSSLAAQTVAPKHDPVFPFEKFA